MFSRRAFTAAGSGTATVQPDFRNAGSSALPWGEGCVGNFLRGLLPPPPDQEPQPFNLTFETPARAPFDHQVLANVAALDAIVADRKSTRLNSSHVALS